MKELAVIVFHRLCHWASGNISQVTWYLRNAAYRAAIHNGCCPECGRKTMMINRPGFSGPYREIVCQHVDCTYNVPW